MLPLYLHARDIVKRQSRCLETIHSESKDVLPAQIEQVISQGKDGLMSYKAMLDGIEKVLKKN